MTTATAQTAQAARAELEALEERVRDGDSTVLPADLSAARQRAEEAVSFAQLQEEAAEREQQRLAAQQWQETGRTLVRRVEALGQDTSVAKAFDEAVAALARLREVSQAYSDEVRQVLGEVGAAGHVGNLADFGLRAGELGLMYNPAVTLRQGSSHTHLNYWPHDHLRSLAVAAADGEALDGSFVQWLAATREAEQVQELPSADAD